MSMSRMQKGIAALAVALVAVVGIGYGGLRYLESGVVESVHNWAKQTPPEMRVELGDVTYTLLNNRLTLSTIKVKYVYMGQDMVSTVAHLEVDNPGSVFLEAMANPDAPIKENVVPLADSVAIQGVTSGPDPELTVAQSSYKNLKIDLAALQEVRKSGINDQNIAKLAKLVSYSSAESTDLKVTVKKDSPFGVPIHFSVQSARLRDFNQGKLASCVLNGLSYKIAEAEFATMAGLTMEGVTSPSDALTMELREFDPEASPEEALTLLGQIFAGPEPLVKKFEIQGFKANLPSPVTLGRMTFTNPTTTPYACSLEIQNLVLTTSGEELQALRMIGLKEIDLSSTLSLTMPDKSGDFKSALSMTLANLGTADFRLDGILPSELGKILLNAGKTEFSDEVLAAAIETLKIGRVELGYADDGLISRVATLSQAMLGMTLQQCLDYVRTYLEQELVTGSPNPAVTRAYAAKILSAIEKPGTMRLVFAAPKPMTAEEIEALPMPSPYESLEVTPGPKTLAEQVEALKK